MSTVKKSPSKNNNNVNSDNKNAAKNNEKPQNQLEDTSTKTPTKRSHPSKIPVKKEPSSAKNTELSKGTHKDTKTNSPQKIPSKTENKQAKKSPSKTKHIEKPNSKSPPNKNVKTAKKSPKTAKTAQKSSSKTAQKSSSKTVQKSSSKTAQKSSSKTVQKSSSKTSSSKLSEKNDKPKTETGTGDATQHRSVNREEQKKPTHKGKPPPPVHVKRTVLISNFKVPPSKPNPDVNQTQPSNHIQRTTGTGPTPYSRQLRPAPPSKNKKPLRSILSRSKMASRVALVNQKPYKLPGSTVKKYPSTVSFRGISSRQTSSRSPTPKSRPVSRSKLVSRSRSKLVSSSRSKLVPKPVSKPLTAVQSDSSIRNKSPPKLPARSYRPLRTHFVSRHKNINGIKLRNKPKFCCTLCKPRKRKRHNNNNGCCCNNFPNYPCPAFPCGAFSQQQQQNFYQSPLPLVNAASLPKSKSNSSTNLKSRSSSSSGSRSKTKLRSKENVTTPNMACYPMMMSVQPYGSYGYSAPVCYPQIPLLPLGSTRSNEGMLNKKKFNSPRRLRNKQSKSNSRSNSQSPPRTKIGRSKSKSKTRMVGRGEMASQVGFPYCPVSMPFPVGCCGMPNYFCPSVPLIPPQVQNSDSGSTLSSVGRSKSRKKRSRGPKSKRRGLSRTASSKYRYKSKSKSRSRFRSKMRSKSKSRMKLNEVQMPQNGQVPMLPVSVPSYGCIGYPMSPLYCPVGQVPPSTADSGSNSSVTKKSKRALPSSRSSSGEKLRPSTKKSSSKRLSSKKRGSRKSRSRTRLKKSRSKSSSKSSSKSRSKSSSKSRSKSSSKENVPTGPYCLYPWFPYGAFCPFPYANPNANQNQNQNKNVPGLSKFARSDTDLLDFGKRAPFASKSTENLTSSKQKPHVNFPNLPQIVGIGNANNNNNAAGYGQFPSGFSYPNSTIPTNQNLNFSNGGPSQGQGSFTMPPCGAFPPPCSSCGPKGKCRALESIRLKYPIGPPPGECFGFGYMPDPGCMILPWTCNGQPAQICCKKNPKVRRECPWYCNHLRHRVRDSQRKNPCKIKFDPCVFCPTWDCFHFN